MFRFTSLTTRVLKVCSRVTSPCPSKFNHCVNGDGAFDKQNGSRTNFDTSSKGDHPRCTVNVDSDFDGLFHWLFDVTGRQTFTIQDKWVHQIYRCSILPPPPVYSNAPMRYWKMPISRMYTHMCILKCPWEGHIYLRWWTFYRTSWSLEYRVSQVLLPAPRKWLTVRPVFEMCTVLTWFEIHW